MKEAVIYEVRLEIDPEIEREYDAWLTGHIAEMLQFDGFIAAEILVPGSDETSPSPQPSPLRGEGTPSKRIVRQVQYHLASQRHLERYFNEHADRMREQGIQRFGNRFSASRTVYDLGVRPARVCQNCGAALRGQYCEECGQRDKHRIISLWELLRDLVGDVFELDSRVWRSLRPLLFKPGLLTMEYLRGRRVHYTPPLRLYLISSLVFFLVVFFNASPNLTFDGDTEPGDIEDAKAILEEAAGDPDTRAISEAIITLENVSGGSAPSDIVAALETLEKTSGNPDFNEIVNAVKTLNDASADTDTDADPGDLLSGPIPESVPDPGSEPEPEAGSQSISDKCEEINIENMPWADTFETRARKVCQNLTAEGGAKRFVRDLIDNTPGMMFFFLPVIALVMAFLYPLSRRYYVEHLLFFVHFHSFFFVILTLTVLFTRLPEVIPGQGIASAVLTTVVTFYIPVYLFIAMRRVYGQTMPLTAVKYAVLGVAYLVSLVFSFTAMAFLTALSSV